MLSYWRDFYIHMEEMQRITHCPNILEIKVILMDIHMYFGYNVKRVEKR